MSQSGGSSGRMIQRRQTLDLSEEESWDLLRGASLGRVVFTMRALPAIRPVNHVVDGDTIVVRSHLGSLIAGQASGEGAVVCYEADDLDAERHTGWSVIVTGTARLVQDPLAVARYERLLEPWAEETGDHIIAITPRMITGIRLIEAGG